MDKAIYQANMQVLLSYVAILNQLELAQMLEAMDRAEAFGPILDPTLYRAASANLRWQKEIVMAALEFQQTVRKIIDQHSPAPMSPIGDIESLT